MREDCCVFPRARLKRFCETDEKTLPPPKKKERKKEQNNTNRTLYLYFTASRITHCIGCNTTLQSHTPRSIPTPCDSFCLAAHLGIYIRSPGLSSSTAIGSPRSPAAGLYLRSALGAGTISSYRIQVFDPASCTTIPGTFLGAGREEIRRQQSCLGCPVTPRLKKRACVWCVE